jgi:FkbM family methyltransferase
MGKIHSHFPLVVTKNFSVEISKTQELSFRSLMRNYRIKVDGILLAGANGGDEISDFVKYKVTNLALFEPVESAFQILSKRTAEFNLTNEIELFNFALGSKEDTARMFVADNEGQSSSLLTPNKEMKEFQNWGVESEEFVEVKRLDSVISEFHNYNLWILDTQGSELEVLKGAGELLMSVDYLIIELNRGFPYENCAQYFEIDEYLSELGFHRLITRWWVIWGDGVYTRKPLFPTLRNIFRRG